MKRPKTFKSNKSRIGACLFITILLALISSPAQAATVTKTIGTSSRDYTTFTLWEADLDDTGIYSASDDAVGEAYNDAAFDESVTINGGGTVGLGTITVNAASGEGHDGTAGTGVRLVHTSGSPSMSLSVSIPITIEWLESDLNSKSMSGISVATDVAAGHAINYVLVHDMLQTGGGADRGGISASNYKRWNATNCIVYDLNITGGWGDLVGVGIRGWDDYANSFMNCTVVDLVNDGSDYAYGFSITNNSNDAVKNCIAADVTGAGAGSHIDFFISGTGPDSQTNLSSDTTADDGGGSGHLISKSSANQFVSTTDGSEDFHLKAGADAIGAGTDLGTSPAGVNIDINGSDRDALTATTWDMGAHQYENIGSIGTSSRDYTTFTLWEADLDDTTIYGPGARARGDAYNDAAFDETATINGGGTVGLNAIKLSVASGERHDGTEGSGARIVRTAAGTILSTVPIAGTDALLLEWLEIDGNGQNVVNFVHNESASPGNVPVLSHLLMHDSLSNSTNAGFVRAATRDVRVQNCIAYNFNTNGGNRDVFGFNLDSDKAEGGALNNTIFNLNATTGTSDATGFKIGSDSANGRVRNNICVTLTANGTAAAYTFAGSTNLTSSNNLSSDDTADDGGGSDHLLSKTAANQFVSATGGSEDLHLKAGADAINAGTDLGTTPTGVEIDIDGRDRDAKGDTWDIGADELVSARRMIVIRLQ